MNTKKILLMALSLILAQGCNEPQAPDHGNTTTPLSCITFTDTAFGIYAMTNWDIDHNGCLTVAEAETVQAIPANAFAGNTALQSLKDLNSFPNLTVIGANAFSGCISLVTADLPNISTVGANAFAGCTSLVSVRLPNASSISEDAFSGCANLTDIVGPVTQNTCTGGAIKCSDNGAQVLICMSNQWMTKETCANGCSNGACISTEPPKTCTKGTLKCSDDNAQVLLCKNDKWISLASCANGCENGVCISSTPAKTCTEGTLKCSDDNAQVLLCKNDKWIALASCANGCANGVCISSTPAKTCTEGAQKCSDDGKQAMICMNDQWVTKDNCDNGCTNGVCVTIEPPKVCTEGALKCSDDGKQAMICLNDQWVNKGNCANGCANGVCTTTPAPNDAPHIGETCTRPYNHECTDDNKQVLSCRHNDSSGYIWTEYESCTYGCENGRCIRWACNEENGSAQCYGGTASICVDGLYQPIESCKYGCNEATGKCNNDDQRYFECGNYPMSQISFNNYVFDLGYNIYEDYYDKIIVDGKFKDLCGKNRVGICEPTNNGRYDGDCYELCAEEGQTIRTCRWLEGDTVKTAPSRVSPGDDLVVADEYICTKVGNQLVYLLHDSIGSSGCDYIYYLCYDRSTPTFTCYSDDSLCTLFAYDIEKYNDSGFTFYARVHMGCKEDEAECPEKCVNGCNFAGTVCLCPEDKCVYGCHDDGSCIWPENCPTTCEDGCYNNSSECFDSSSCYCTYEHIGPGIWGWSCEEDECYKFYH